jgi:hypothetical protein
MERRFIQGSVTIRCVTVAMSSYISNINTEILWPPAAEPYYSSSEHQSSCVSLEQSARGLCSASDYLFRLVLISSHTATLKSWDIKYVGKANVLLSEHLANYSVNNYARYISIIQSLSMGKSCTVDEFLKTHLVVPLNLHQEEHGIFPGISVCSTF